MTVDVYIAI